jgi:hypothetical protein
MITMDLTMCCMFCWENSVLRFQKMIYKLWVTQVQPLPSHWHQCVMRCMFSSMGNLQVWHSHLYAFSCSGLSQDNNSNKNICLWINQTKVLEFLSPPNILLGGGLWVWVVDQVVQWVGMYEWIRKSFYKQAATALHYSQWQLVCKCVPASSWLLTHCLSEITELVNSQFKTALNMHPNCLLWGFHTNIVFVVTELWRILGDMGCRYPRVCAHTRPAIRWSGFDISHMGVSGLLPERLFSLLSILDLQIYYSHHFWGWIRSQAANCSFLWF